MVIQLKKSEGGLPRSEWAQNGFENTTDSSLTWTNSSPDRTLSIQPTSSYFNYWVGGYKFTSTGNTFQITDVEGIHVLYYDDTTLTEHVNPSSSDIDNIIRNYALVSIIYWDATDSEAIYVGEERHGKNMSPSVHAYHHFIDGLRYLSGLGLNTMSVDENGSSDSHAQFGTDSGSVTDEDLFLFISPVGSTTGLPIYYMLGSESGPRWVRHLNSGFSVRTLDGTTSTRLAYNENNAGTWQLTEESNGDYVLYHVFASTEKDSPMICVMGQNGYSTRSAARSGAETEIHNLTLDQIMFPEIRPIATIIYQTKLSYGNAVNARVVSTDDGDDYIDWRNEVISRVELSTSEHNNLSGKQGGATNEFYHLAEAAYNDVSVNYLDYVLTNASRVINGNQGFQRDEGLPGTVSAVFTDWLTGSGTSFNVDFVAGDTILIDGTGYTVLGISGATLMQISSIVSFTNETYAKRTSSSIWGGEITTISILDAVGNSFTPAQAKAAYNHTSLTNNPHSVAASDIGSASKIVKGVVELATTAEIDAGTDSTRAIPVDQFVASKRNIRFLAFNLVEAGTDVATGTNIGGDFVMPLSGTILQSDTTKQWLMATNSTAGTTGTMVVDGNKNGTTIMTTNKLDIETGEKTTEDATTQPDLTTTTVAAGDIITIDIDVIHSGTAAKGLTVYLAVRES